MHLIQDLNDLGRLIGAEHAFDARGITVGEAVGEHSSPSRKTGEMCMWPGVSAVLRVVRIRGRGNPLPKRERLRETAWSMVPVPA